MSCSTNLWHKHVRVFPESSSNLLHEAVGRSAPCLCDDSSGQPFFLKNLAGRLASQPCIWIHPSILGVYYWYWYIIGCFFPIMGGIFPILSCPPEACPLLASSERRGQNPELRTLRPISLAQKMFREGGSAPNGMPSRGEIASPASASHASPIARPVCRRDGCVPCSVHDASEGTWEVPHE